MIKNIFWNGVESRLRSGWRLLFQFILFFIFIIIFAIIDHTFFRSLPRSRIGATDSIFLPLEMFLSGLLSVYLFGRFIDKRPFTDFGLHISKLWWIDLIFGILLAFLMMLSIFLVSLFAGWVTVVGYCQSKSYGFGFIADLFIIFFSIFFMAILEELNSRGYQLKNLAEGLNTKRLGRQKGLILAVILISFSFGILHYDSEAGFMSIIALILGGLPYCIAFALTGELAIPIGFHIAWNFSEGCIFGFPVSGVDLGATIISTEISGPEYWTGGAFGPEISPLGIAAHIIPILFIVLWVKYRRGNLRNMLT